MVAATVTSKGQVTIPKVVRSSLNLHAGDKISFVMHGEGEVILIPVTKSVDEVFGKLHQKNRSAVSVDQMNSAIKRRMKS